MTEMFNKALRRFLNAAGLMEGRSKDEINDTLGVSPRTLARWLNGETIPSRGSWSVFRECLQARFETNQAALQALDKLEKVRLDAHRMSHKGSDTGDDSVSEAPESIPASRSITGPISLRGNMQANTSEALYKAFLADTRIAAQISTTPGMRAVYLDKVYVHRSRPETAALKTIDSYLNAEMSVVGKWLSIVGDAGHGKTSFLWSLVQECHHRCPNVYPVQALQLSSNSLDELVNSLPRDGNRFILVLDTLDLLVGIDDTSLSASLNRIRAGGGLLITTCRRQEIQLLAHHIRSDQIINLERFEPSEARAAIVNYVDASYEDWPKVKQAAQAEFVWGLLDAQRKIQDLNYEPLLLRMIFEAYVPDDIPTDINTQRVYDHFWEERVCGDRLAKNAEQAYARSAISKALAAYMYFEAESHSDRVSTDAFVERCRLREDMRPRDLLKGLVSSGVLRWWQMSASVGFFHQTFLEYAAAKSLLESDDGIMRDQRIDHLLIALERADLFRVPVLKQLLIQASGENPRLFEWLCRSVTDVDTTVAAGLLLEVLGKAREVSDLRHRVLDWNLRQPHLIRAVATEVLRHFPSKRVELALEILYPHMHGEAIGEICNVCSTYFAPMAPDSTLRFLYRSWQAFPAAFEEFRGPLKTSLVAVFKAGNGAVLDILLRILPSLSERIQAAAITELSALWTSATAREASAFLEQLFFPLVVAEPNEPRSSFVKAFAALYAVGPEVACSLANTLRMKAGESPERKAAMLLARVVGITNPEPSVIDAAFADLLGNDHIRRVCASYLLREAARSNDDILDRILALPQDTTYEKETRNVIATVASGSQNAPKVLGVLDRWNPTERGAGNAYRLLMETAANTDPKSIIQWLKTRILAANSDSRRRQILIGFQVVVENAAKSISSADARLFWKFSFLSKHSTDEMKRVFASTAGWLTECDEGLAREAFNRVFRSRNQEIINAAIGSLRRTGSPEFILFVFELVRAFTAHQKGHAALGHFLEVLSERELDVRAALLRELATPTSRALIRRLDSPVVVSRVLTLLKSTVKIDIGLVLDLAEECPLIDDGNRATLSAVLENASHYTEDIGFARQILTRLLELANNQSDRVGNSLRRALPRLDRVLPHREAANSVLQKILNSPEWPERAKEQMVRAAKSMDSWNQSDKENVLRSDLPHTVKAVLLH